MSVRVNMPPNTLPNQLDTRAIVSTSSCDLDTRLYVSRGAWYNLAARPLRSVGGVAFRQRLGFTRMTPPSTGSSCRPDASSLSLRRESPFRIYVESSYNLRACAPTVTVNESTLPPAPRRSMELSIYPNWMRGCRRMQSVSMD